MQHEHVATLGLGGTLTLYPPGLDPILGERPGARLTADGLRRGFARLRIDTLYGDALDLTLDPNHDLGLRTPDGKRYATVRLVEANAGRAILEIRHSGCAIEERSTRDQAWLESLSEEADELLAEDDHRARLDAAQATADTTDALLAEPPESAPPESEPAAIAGGVIHGDPAHPFVGTADLDMRDRHARAVADEAVAAALDHTVIGGEGVTA